MHLRPALLACLLLAAFPVIATEPVRAVEHLDIDRYAGQWHEIAHLPVSFQKQCVGDITANYGLRRDGRISVTNACRKGDGERVVAEGVARPVAGHPGQLQVRFVPDWLSWAPMVWADYWVLALDPDYQWALVGEPGRKYLWILSRLPEMERDRFEQLKAKAESMGYDLGPLRLMPRCAIPRPTEPLRIRRIVRAPSGVVHARPPSSRATLCGRVAPGDP